MLTIKILSIVISVLGLLISLGEMLDLIIDKDRASFAKIIKEEFECSKDHAGAKKFINDFVCANQAYTGFDMAEVEKVKFVGTFIVNDNVRSASSGNIILRSFDKKSTVTLCSFQDLIDWSKQNPIIKWLGWGIVATGVLLGAVLLIIEEFT